jgi:pro-apoptotic serine protease NMA111
LLQTDFGFFKFQTREDLTQIELAPQEAIPGTEIFVVGNNSAESLMILPSVLARVDRECPQYDMNTFYCTGANNTSGGSSGSPVLNRSGKAVALNSGGKVDTAVSYFFPLDGIVFALERIQKDERIPRADLFTLWKHISYDEAKRLSLPEKYINEHKVSKTNKHNGLLVADNVLRDLKENFPAKTKRVLTGDLLLKINGHFVSDHWSVECILGENIDKEVTVEGSYCFAFPVHCDVDGYSVCSLDCLVLFACCSLS